MPTYQVTVIGPTGPVATEQIEASDEDVQASLRLSWPGNSSTSGKAWQSV
jgi:hypothetical protein